MMRDTNGVDVKYCQDESRTPFSFAESVRFIEMVISRIVEDLERDGRFHDIDCGYDNSSKYCTLVSCIQHRELYISDKEKLPRKHLLSRRVVHTKVLLEIRFTQGESSGSSYCNKVSGEVYYGFGRIKIYDPRVEEILSKALALYYKPFADVPLPKFFKGYNDTERKLFLAREGDKVEIDYAETKPASDFVYNSGLVVKP